MYTELRKNYGLSFSRGIHSVCLYPTHVLPSIESGLCMKTFAFYTFFWFTKSKNTLRKFESQGYFGLAQKGATKRLNSNRWYISEDLRLTYFPFCLLLGLFSVKWALKNVMVWPYHGGRCITDIHTNDNIFFISLTHVLNQNRLSFQLPPYFDGLLALPRSSAAFIVPKKL